MGCFFQHHLWRTMALILICAGMIGAASAVLITASPSHVLPGEPITITIDGLSNSSTFSLLIEATLQVTPGQDYLFETTNFVMPVSLSNGQISATTSGTKKATYSAKKGTTEVSVTRAADADGVFSFSQAQSIPAGTYDFFRLQGTPLPATGTVVSTIQILGEKTGPDASRISFAVNGIDNGRILAIVYVDGSQALYQTVTVGNGIIPFTTPPVPPATTSAPYSGGGTATPTPSPAGSSKTFFSADRNVSLTVTGAEYAGLVPVSATGVPPTWSIVGNAYAIAPDSLSFSPAATIAFSLPAPTNTPLPAQYFIGRYRNSEWVRVPGTVQGTEIAAAIDTAGTYALMTYRTPGTDTSSATPAPLQPAVSAGTPTTDGTPASAPVTQESSPEPATTRKTPLGSVVLFGALAIGAGIVLWKK
jgi:hypothetical protein